MRTTRTLHDDADPRGRAALAAGLLGLAPLLLAHGLGRHLGHLGLAGLRHPALGLLLRAEPVVLGLLLGRHGALLARRGDVDALREEDGLDRRRRQRALAQPVGDPVALERVLLLVLDDDRVVVAELLDRAAVTAGGGVE